MLLPPIVSVGMPDTMTISTTGNGNDDGSGDMTLLINIAVFASLVKNAEFPCTNTAPGPVLGEAEPSLIAIPPPCRTLSC